MTSTILNNLSEIKHAFYINLESRPDRQMYVEEELKKIGFKKIKRIFTNVKYENLRNIFTHFYQNPNLKESKFLYGSGLINVLVQK